MSDVDTLREPQRHQPHAEVPAPVPRPWPTRPVPLRATVAGAGRVMDLDEFLAVTVATALVVVVDGILVHEQYFHGTRAGDRLLGNSATKSALALLVGQAVDDGRLPGLDTPRDRPGSRAGLQRVRRGEPAPAPHHDQRRRMARGLPRPGQPGLAAAAPVARWRGRPARVTAGDAAGRPAGQQVRLLHPGLPGPGLGARAGDRRALRRPRWRGLWSAIEAEQPAVVGLDQPGGASPWPAARWPPPRATGRASARCRSTAGGRDRQVVSRVLGRGEQPA